MQCLELPHRKNASSLSPARKVAWALPICSASLARLRSTNLAGIAVSWSVAAAEARL